MIRAEQIVPEIQWIECTFVKKGFMNKYVVSGDQPNNHFFGIEFRCPTNGEQILNIQLPGWRPGRYELGNFAKNVKGFCAENEKGQKLEIKKLTKDKWEVKCPDSNELIIRYYYFAAELNAGSTFLSEEQWYMNPVNCCVYVENRIEESIGFHLLLPEQFKVATGMKQKKGNLKNEIILSAASFHELADSPFIASANLKHNEFAVNSVPFHIWIQGECKPDWNRIITDFKAFTSKQVEAYKEFPAKEYHFLLHVLPVNFYHGVEHLNSSVNALGPGYELMKERYDDLLGLCSHELYHSWNIKSIRPQEMFPYNYTRENYFKTGYVAEGVTTYMGDFFLLSSGVFSTASFLAEMTQQMNKHMDNPGRKNYSVADSSFDTWLDGYVPGVPGRKVSIYTEGCLLAFIADVEIMRGSKNKHRLHDVMHELYYQFAKKNKGYSAEEYKLLLEKYAGGSFDDYFAELVNGTTSYLPKLKEAMEYLGFLLVENDPGTQMEKHYGIRISETQSGTVVITTHEKVVSISPEIAINDKILSVNGYTVNNDLAKWIDYFSGENLKLVVSRMGEVKVAELNYSPERLYSTWRWTITEQPTESQKQNLKYYCNQLCSLKCNEKE